MNNIITITHGNILRTFFSFISGKYSKYFNNCCIIKCFLINDFIYFKMIYEGYDNIKKNKSFTINDFNMMNYKMSNINLLNNNTIIYLIRHGEAEHNIIKYSKIFNKNLLDSKLTNNGHSQAIETGVFLNNYIDKNFNNNKYIFCSSSLFRTQQTCINIKNSFTTKYDEIYVIPFINEIIYINEYFYNLGIIDDFLKLFYYTNTPNFEFHKKNKNIINNTKILWNYYNYIDNYKFCINKKYKNNIIHNIISTIKYYSKVIP